MRFIQPKVYLALLVYILTLSPQACLVEQVISAAFYTISHGHGDEKSLEHHESAPLHKHDDAESENLFCCDNNLNLYLVNKTVSKVDICDQFISCIALITIVEKQTVPLQDEYHLHRFRQIPTIRGGDKYALTCLLHAPPQI